EEVEDVAAEVTRERFAEGFVLAAVLGVDADPAVEGRTDEAFDRLGARDGFRDALHPVAVLGADLDGAVEPTHGVQGNRRPSSLKWRRRRSSGCRTRYLRPAGKGAGFRFNDRPLRALVVARGGATGAFEFGLLEERGGAVVDGLHP